MAWMCAARCGARGACRSSCSPRAWMSRTGWWAWNWAPTPAEVIRAGELSLDRARFKVNLPDREVTLTPTEFEILAVMAAQPGRVFSRAQLLTAAHGVAFDSYERAIDSHIRN